MIVLVKILRKTSFLIAQLLLGFFVLIIGCGSHRDLIQISGQTMGTTYSIKIILESEQINPEQIKSAIDSILTIINKQMSTWDPTSEISQFNSFKSTEPFQVSKSFANVVESALDISEKTNGVFDITVFDLMRLWGFGPNPKSGIPDPKEIEKVLTYSGIENISLQNGSIIKKNPLTRLDLNAIAKGYAVDEVFLYLEGMGLKNIFVEIGGEVRCIGKNQRNKYWSIAIENPPSSHHQTSNFAAVVYIDSKSIATSGNYRNFVDLNGEILGHTINPTIGFPVQTNVLSVTVQAESCMEADAWATALMAMNYESGLKKVSEYPEIKAVWIIKREDDIRRIARSDGAIIEDSIYEFIQ